MIQSFLVSMLLYCMLTLPIYGLLRFLWMRKRPVNKQYEIAMLLFFCFCISIFSQTILPEYWFENGHIVLQLEPTFLRHNFTPFRTISLYMAELHGPIAEIAFYNLAGNIILFIPFGFFIPLLWTNMRSAWKMLLLALAIPLFIESCQLFIGRSTDIDDVILNAIAIVLGYIFYQITQFLRKKVVTTRESLLK
ncbi:VanZ family protein [Metasolibacillus meyeri]|uniref:VanZ family protein n=1 Tax=Metasolibacillus meyeri TaxID=1071052 RepID=A0AAW9NWI1_9BACL|nr:VanZ family protein [Metasolibacillus meyeri]MEC1178703.1 VanZ family protein [Metasolibacillus meyeri]